MNSIINVNTKISTLLKAHPDALSAIVSLSPKFNKLQNPLLRKLMAPRTSISMACKIGRVSAKDFLDKLKPLGFLIDDTIAEEKTTTSAVVPAFMKYVLDGMVLELDVRPAIDNGSDPLNSILEKIKELKPKQVLKLTNSFEPIPLIQLLSKRGFESFTETVSEDLVNTYFYSDSKESPIEPVIANSSEDWDDKLKRYSKQILTIDVRHLEMPLPMLTILEELDNLPVGNALYVHHKCIPVFLLPELKERNFNYLIKEINDGEVHLLIYKE